MEFSLKTLVGFILAIFIAVVIGVMLDGQLVGAKEQLISIIQVN